MEDFRQAKDGRIYALERSLLAALQGVRWDEEAPWAQEDLLSEQAGDTRRTCGPCSRAGDAGSVQRQCVFRGQSHQGEFAEGKVGKGQERSQSAPQV